MTTALPDAAGRFLQGVCSLDIDLAASGLSAEARLSAGAGPLAIGKARIRRLLILATSRLESIRFDPAVVWFHRNLAIVEADLCCQRCDHARLDFPVTLTLYFRDNLIFDIHVHTYEAAVISVLGAMRPRRRSA